MLKFRAEQMEHLKLVALKRFEDEMVTHAASYSPRLYEIIGIDKMRIAVRQALERAKTYGFTFRGPLRLYVEMILLHGSDFDTDPQYVPVAKMLKVEKDQMLKAHEIYDHAVHFQQKIAGPDGERVFKALEYLSFIAKSPDYQPSDDPEHLAGELTRAFPEKAEYVGKSGLLALIEHGREAADDFEMTTARARTMVVAMMYAFGHGCLADPLYPWISKTLNHERITDGADRAVRLEKRAVIWLDHVLAALKPEGGA